MTRREWLSSAAGGLGCLLAGEGLAGARLDPEIIGANTAVTGYSLARAIELIAELDFPVIEIQPMGVPEATPGQFPGFDFDRLPDAERKRIKQSLSNFRMVTAHLPYTDLHHLSRFAPVAEFSRERVEVAIEGAAYFGSKVSVLHPEEARQSLEQSWTERLRLYRRWGDMAKARGMQIALETGYPRSVVDYVRLIQEIDHSHIGATIDVGHQARYQELTARVEPSERGTPKGIKAYNDVTHEIIDRLGPKVFHFHVHDIEPDTWAEHKPLIHGFVDYPRLVRKLEKIDYRGVLIFEIGGDPERMPDYLAEGKRKLEAYLAAEG